MLCIYIYISLSIDICYKSPLLSQAIAIQQSLHLNPSEELNVSNFVDDLINKMDKIEGDTRYILYYVIHYYI